jgi:hypothetical protein
MYLTRYNRLLFGQEEPDTSIKAGLVQKEVEPVSKAGGSRRFLFH